LKSTNQALPPSFRNQDTVTRFSTEITKEYSIRWAFHTQPYAGIPTLLEALVRKRIKLAVLSNKPHAFTVEQVKKLLSRWNFRKVTGESASVPRKPDPTGALEISKKLQVNPAEFLYLGGHRH
jgi:phosphoglycolate phosphatase